MRLAPPDFAYQWTLPDNRVVRLRSANPDELQNIQALYIATYGDRYGLNEVMDPDKAGEVIMSPDWHWMLAECEDRIMGSLIFGAEPRHRIAKALGGVVHTDFRGQKIMRIMLEQGLRLHLREGGPLDMVYAVVRTFISLAFHHDLAQLGFVDTGIFPNVRKVKEYETHGLKVLLGHNAYFSRRTPPRLIPELYTLYSIVRARLGLKPPQLVDWHRKPITNERVELALLAEADTPARRRFLHQTSRGQVFNFFPLHAPDLILVDSTRKTRVFLSFQVKDGHATVLGINPGQHDRLKVLLSVADYCERLGCVYLELLVSAYEPEQQAEAYQAGFLPCAYFPAAFRGEDGRREDYVVTSKTFVPLHFRGLKLTEESKPFLLEFFKLFTSSLWEDLMDA